MFSGSFFSNHVQSSTDICAFSESRGGNGLYSTPLLLVCEGVFRLASDLQLLQ